jgi:molybdopterin synthase sulfur carrier subunit
MNGMMNVQVRYFASLRELLGSGEVLLLEAESTVGAIRDKLIACSPAHAQALARGRAVRTALNQSLCDDAMVVNDDAELAFFPPVTGG